MRLADSSGSKLRFTRSRQREPSQKRGTTTTGRIRPHGLTRIASGMTRRDGENVMEQAQPPAETSPRKTASSLVERKPVTREMIDRIFSLICLLHREQETEVLQELYWQGLSDLTDGQAALLGSLIVRETEFWPAPARLRRLVGIPSAEDAQAAHAKAKL